MNPRLKGLIERTLASAGYTIRALGPRSAVAGVDLVADVAALIVEPRPVMFDVGANVGQTVGDVLRLLRTASVHAFEPSPESFRRLSARFGSHPRVTLNQTALGDEAGTIAFHVTDNDSVNDSALPRAYDVRTTPTTVPATTVDAYCAERGIDAIDFLKVDAQGFDLRVLRGAVGMLRGRRVGFFCAEIMMEPMYHGQPTLPELLTFAGELGYRLVGFYDQNYLRNELNYLNACFRRPSN